MSDLLIIETGNGGDAVLRGNDLVLVHGIENKPYLSMFGGDIDWWANDYENPTKPELIWSSETEATLQGVPLNSSGRLKIEQAIVNDLAILKKQTNSQVVVTATITSNNRIEILVQIDNLDVVYIWNPDTAFLTYKI